MGELRIVKDFLPSPEAFPQPIDHKAELLAGCFSKKKMAFPSRKKRGESLAKGFYLLNALYAEKPTQEEKKLQHQALKRSLKVIDPW